LILIAYGGKKSILKKLIFALSSLWVLSVIAIVLVGTLRVSSDGGGVVAAATDTVSVNAGYVNTGSRGDYGAPAGVPEFVPLTEEEIAMHHKAARKDAIETAEKLGLEWAPSELTAAQVEEEAARKAARNAAIAEAEKYAYLDIESASDELREKILSSRNIIIFSKDWVADGVGIGGTGSIYSDEVEVAPYFSELFPGWDIP
jgi:hypothetical protein